MEDPWRSIGSVGGTHKAIGEVLGGGGGGGGGAGRGPGGACRVGRRGGRGGEPGREGRHSGRGSSSFAGPVAAAGPFARRRGVLPAGTAARHAADRGRRSRRP